MTPRLSTVEQACDLQRFAKLNGKLDLFPHIAPVFVRQAEQWLQRLAAAMAAGDQAQVLDLLHHMKGSSAGICATPLCDAIQHAESRVVASGLGASRDQLEGIAAQLTHLNQLLSGLAD
jgi:HPt (histidine-containing phosphotransfer) domain-containing protein